MGKILYAYMVPMSETLKAFFQRLNQSFHMTLVNKCQVSNVKPQNILLRKVADNLISHTNKLRHGGINQRAFTDSSLLMYAFSLYVKTSIHGNAQSVSRDPQRTWLGFLGKK